MRSTGPRLEITIFEPRQFSEKGPAGCNRCAGILSSSFVNNLASLDLQLPESVIQSHIAAYSVHFDGETHRILPPSRGRKILSIYRGGGPRLSKRKPESSFDQFLLSKALEGGAHLVPNRVVSVEQGRPFRLRTKHQEYPAEFIVLASGVNSRSPLDPTFGYHPPRTAIMRQDEIRMPNGWPVDEVGTFFREPPGLVFGALIPKDQFLNVSLLGDNFTADAVSEFLEALGQNARLNNLPVSLCGCAPRIAVGASRRYFGDGWVAVGDAAVTRLYKDGIGSAFITAQAAVAAVVEFGISARALQRGYAPICRKIAWDNHYGGWMFRLWRLLSRSPRLSKAWSAALRAEENLALEDHIHGRIIWGMLSGDESYRALFRLALSMRSAASLWRALEKNQGS